MRARRLRQVALGLVLIAASARAGELPGQKVLSQFVGKYCLKCHDAETEKGDREFESFKFPLATEAALITAKDIIDQLTLGEMPPSKEAKRPTDDERLAVIRALRKGIASARGRIESTQARTVMRRLSNREYENTLATLFGRRMDTLGLTADFPKEKASEHIDTIGKSLVTSGFLLDQYFQSANRLVETRLGRPEMPPQSWHFNGHFVQYEELSGSHKEAFNYRYLCLYEQPNTSTRQGGYGHIEDFLQGVPVSGLYDIEVEAQAMHRDTHYDPALFGIDFSEPFLLGVVPGDATKNHIHYPQAIEPLLAQATVPDEKPEWIKFRVWLEAGQTPRFIFPNGPYESRASVIQINRRYADDFQGRFAKAGVRRGHLLKEGKLPHIRISEIKIEGPIPEPDGSMEEIAVFGERGFQAKHALDQLYAFGARAYRRPLTRADRASIRKTYEMRIGEKATPRQAALDTLKMILCSPSFLYFSEITDEKETRLGSYDLASRLSYALWSAPPDQELFAAAASRKLTAPKELRQQSMRLLADDRVGGNLIHHHAQQRGAAALDMTLPSPAVPAHEPELSLVLMMDGWMARERGADWGASPRKKDPQRIAWHEIKSAIIYRLEQRAEKASGRGLLLEKFIVACPPQTAPVDFGAAVEVEARRRGLGRARHVYLVMDGAVWLWDLAEDRFATAVKTLDFHHASEHLWAVGHALYGEGSAEAVAWVEKLLHRLRHGGEARVVRRLQELLEPVAGRSAETQALLQREANYFATHREHMHYQAMERAGAPIGSGAVESLGAQLQRRFRCSGQFWMRPGLSHLLALAVLFKNQDEAHLWN